MNLFQQLLTCLILVSGQVQHQSFIPPPPHGGISSTYMKNQSTFYFHSGLQSESTFLEGIQRIYDDEVSETWRYRPSQNIFYPDTRAFYSSFLYKDRYYIFGGIGETAIFRDIWYYDIIWDLWVKLFSPNPISRRYSFSYTTFTFNNTFYFAVAGGKSETYADNLLDFYIMDVEKVTWITQSNYSTCFELGLSGGQMEFYDGSLYLFAGKNVNRENITFMSEICKYTIQPNLALSTWQALELKVPLYNTSRGGSCVHEGFFYSFFGFNLDEKGFPQDLKSVARLDLSNVEVGWKTLTISGCEELGNELARNGFGYSYSEGSVYINGGFSNDLLVNSIFRLDLDNSETNVNCSVNFLSKSNSPSRRVGASMVYVAGKFYLFGGKDKGVYLGDLYTLDLDTLTWSEVVSYGSIPSPRCFHASASEGKYMVIAGGISNGVLQKDYFLLETETMTWTLIVPKSAVRPPPVYSSCIAIQFPKIYSVGGAEDSHITNSLWEFDISTDTFVKLYDYKKGIDTGFFGHGCGIEEIKGNKIVTVYFGSSSLIDIPHCYITRFNLSESKDMTPKSISFFNSKFPCRCHNAYDVIDKNYVLIAGGERYQQEFFNDIWMINRNTLDVYHIADMNDSAYLSAFSFFNNTIYIYSGYNINGLSVNFPSSDFVVQIGLSDLKLPDLQLSCGLGMQKNGNTCEFCQHGTYSNYSSLTCVSCPAGYINTVIGATSIYQCIPCPEGTYSKEKSSECLPCPEDKTCYVGANSKNWLSESDMDEVHHYRHHKDQPELYEPPNTIMFKSILWVIVFGIIFLFTLIFFLDWRVRIFMSYYDIYKNNHVEKVCDENGELVPKSLVIEPSVPGGYFSFITSLILIAISIDSLYNYIMTNVQEQIVLVPIDTLIDKEDFDDNSLKVYMMFSSYRGDCSFTHMKLTHSDNVKVESRHIESKSPLCEFYYHMKTTDIIETGDFIRFYFNDSLAYTSDINVRLKTHSSIPGTNSIVTQHVEATKDLVFRGSEDTNFYFSFLPSYYKEIDTFGEFSRLGYVLSISNQPAKGTEVDPREIGIYSGLGININLMRIEVGITTYKSPQVEFMDYMLKFMTDFPGTIVMFGFCLWFYELFYNLFKGKSSGRNLLVKREIEKERARRHGRQDSFISSGINN